jgi:hypothetical protein
VNEGLSFCRRLDSGQVLAIALQASEFNGFSENIRGYAGGAGRVKTGEICVTALSASAIKLHGGDG